jgi:sugar lactone lactonase YvrE
MRQLEVIPLVKLSCRLGEGPLWHPNERSLYCVDIEGKSIWRIDLEPRETEEFTMKVKVGCLGLRSQGGFILAGEKGFATWDPTKNELDAINHPETDRPHARFNDGAVDPGGRFWAGTMTPEGFENSLYRLDPDCSVHKMETDIGISNGMDWSPDQSTMYFTDSTRKIIYAYDYEVETGEIENRRVWVDSQAESGEPDGLCVDSEGCVWSARWDGWRISRYDPQGKLMFELRTPVQRPTSCTFGGSDLQTLFITSAWSGLTKSERRTQPLAGDLFIVETDVLGQTPNLFKG